MLDEVEPPLTEVTESCGDVVSAKQPKQSESSVNYDKGPFEHFAFSIGYAGSAFRGLQLQAHTYTHHTVEGTIIQALRDAGLVRSLERGKIGDFGNQFFRSCRTDKGVHAIRNVLSWSVSSRFLQVWQTENKKEPVVNNPGKICELITAALNAQLPPVIRIFATMRVSRSFHPKNNCNRRIYRYLIPLYAIFGNCDDWDTLAAKYPDLFEEMSSTQLAGLQNIKPHDGGVGWGAATAKAISQGNEVLRSFLGSRRYHNYCGGSSGDDRLSMRAVVSPLSDEAVRMIYRCELVSKILLLDSNAIGSTRSWLGGPAVSSDYPKRKWLQLPFIVFQVEGASFLLNMIRKMVGMLVAVLRGARVGLVEESLSPGRKMIIPMAPAQHLTLINSFYGSYDASAPSGFETFMKVHSGNKVAEGFLEHHIHSEIVDIDLGRTPLLETLLVRRNKVMTHAQLHDDEHLLSMKEFVPISAHGLEQESGVLPAVMTSFVRALRVHNWAMKLVPVPEGSKAANGEKNRNAQSVNCDSEGEPDAEVLTFRKRSRDGDEILPESDDGWICSFVGDERKVFSRRYAKSSRALPNILGDE